MSVLCVTVISDLDFCTIMKKTAVYAGSFDPPTRGHEWMIRQGAVLFDELIVVLAVNPDKRYVLPEPVRESLLRELVCDLPNVRVCSMSGGFLAEFAGEQGATHLLRGVRNAVDFDYEKSMLRFNARMEPSLQTVLLVPPAELEDISSSFVRGIMNQPGAERWLAECLSAPVLECLLSQR